MFIELDVVPGKLSELESYLQDSFVPLVKSGGAPAFVIHETYLGEASEMTLALPIGNYATLDVIFAGLPETDPMDSLTDHIQLSLLAFASELSYLP